MARTKTLERTKNFHFTQWKMGIVMRGKKIYAKPYFPIEICTIIQISHPWDVNEVIVVPPLLTITHKIPFMRQWQDNFGPAFYK